MTIISIFITVLARVLNIAILARVLLSWIPMNPSNPLVRFIFEVTEPIMAPIRRLIPSMGGLDLSPVIALILIEMLERILLTVLSRVG